MEASCCPVWESTVQVLVDLRFSTLLSPISFSSPQMPDANIQSSGYQYFLVPWLPSFPTSPRRPLSICRNDLRDSRKRILAVIGVCYCYCLQSERTKCKIHKVLGRGIGSFRVSFLLHIPQKRPLRHGFKSIKNLY